MEPLSFEEFKHKFYMPPTQALIDSMQESHDIDAVAEINMAIRRDYDQYLIDLNNK